jgi:hypothetical protein
LNKHLLERFPERREQKYMIMAEIQVWDIAPSMRDSEENHKKL